MKDFDALKDIWHGQKGQPGLSYDEVRKTIKSSKANFANKLLFEALAVIAVITLLVMTALFGHFILWTSHVSLLILICCCLYYFFVQLSHYLTLRKSDILFQQPGKYIDYLRRYRLKRYQLNTRSYLIYSIFIGLAFALYFVEVYVVAPLWQTAAGVLFTIGWFMLCSVLMKGYIKKEQEKLNVIIHELQKLKDQLEQES